MKIIRCLILILKQKIIYNELDTIIADTFRKALNGEYHDEDRWISKDEFDRLKYVDGYVAICFSFGNDCKTYLYSKAIEPYKCACHYSEGKQPERLQHRERLRRINNISNNGNIEVYSSDYKELELPIPDECVIYCDIPYEKTKRYKQKFDYNMFYDWVEEKTKAGYQIYISSYELPEDKFTEVWRKEKYEKVDSKTPQHVIEKIFIPTSNVKKD